MYDRPNSLVISHYPKWREWRYGWVGGKSLSWLHVFWLTLSACPYAAAQNLALLHKLGVAILHLLSLCSSWAWLYCACFDEWE